MSPKYKLSYFNLRVLGEPIRFLLAYGNIEYEDHRIEFSAWPEVKPTTPFGKYPNFEVDGEVIDQHTAICRYVAKQVKLTGESDWEDAKIDAIVATIYDLFIPFQQAHNTKDPETKAELMETARKVTLPFYLKKLENLVKKNGGYLVGNHLTWADLYFAAISEAQRVPWDLKDLQPDYPNLKVLQDKVYNIPQIRKWMDTRPVTEF